MFQQRMSLLGHYVYRKNNIAEMLQTPPRGCKTLPNGDGARVSTIHLANKGGVAATSTASHAR